jgi:hypothetical protein
MARDSLLCCTQGLALHSLRLSMKVNQRRNKRRADAIDDRELNGSNILHCLVDPHSEWLANITVLQSEAMLKMQLLHMREVDAQIAAIKALSDLIEQVRSVCLLKHSFACTRAGVVATGLWSPPRRCGRHAIACRVVAHACTNVLQQGCQKANAPVEWLRSTYPAQR